MLIIRGRAAGIGDGLTRHQCRVGPANHTLATHLYTSRYSVSDGYAEFFGDKIAYRETCANVSYKCTFFLTFSAALGIARTSSALHSLARKFALRFSAALGNMSKLYCTRLHENWRRLGIIQVNLASALALHKRCILRQHRQQKTTCVSMLQFISVPFLTGH